MNEFVQIFRNGVIEAVSTTIATRPLPNQSFEKAIASTYFENNILETFPAFISILKSIPVQLPLSINLNIINANGISLLTGEPFYGRQQYSKKRLRMVDVQMQSYDDELPVIFKPVFDSLWNTFGYPESRNTSI